MNTQQPGKGPSRSANYLSERVRGRYSTGRRRKGRASRLRTQLRPTSRLRWPSVWAPSGSLVGGELVRGVEWRWGGEAREVGRGQFVRRKLVFSWNRGICQRTQHVCLKTSDGSIVSGRGPFQG